ncbi:hypothetical protein OKW38_002821 [Paraburkholderia sp. MM5496-R1]|uniref:hypothetical protein n=1 Tax=unclassified Paraburkholderia TaxID=2615204 RepID=UPI003D1DB233
MGAVVKYHRQSRSLEIVSASKAPIKPRAARGGLLHDQLHLVIPLVLFFLIADVRSRHVLVQTSRPQTKTVEKIALTLICGIHLAVSIHSTQPETEMATSPKQKNPASDKSEEDVDKAVEESFPGSDPPATGGTTRIESEDGEEADEDEPNPQ